MRQAKLRGTRLDEMVVSLAARAIRLPEQMADGLRAEGDVAIPGIRSGSDELNVSSAKTERVNVEGIVPETQRS